LLAGWNETRDRVQPYTDYAKVDSVVSVDDTDDIPETIGTLCNIESPGTPVGVF